MSDAPRGHAAASGAWRASHAGICIGTCICVRAGVGEWMQPYRNVRHTAARRASMSGRRQGVRYCQTSAARARSKRNEWRAVSKPSERYFTQCRYAMRPHCTHGWPSAERGAANSRVNSAVPLDGASGRCPVDHGGSCTKGWAYHPRRIRTWMRSCRTRAHKLFTSSSTALSRCCHCCCSNRRRHASCLGGRSGVAFDEMRMDVCGFGLCGYDAWRIGNVCRPRTRDERARCTMVSDMG